MLTFLLLSLTRGASAQETPEINAQAYSPPIDADATMWTNDAALKPNLYWSARLGLSYMKNPLVYRFADDAENRLLANELQANLLGAFTLSRFRFGVDVPVMLWANGIDQDDNVTALSAAGLGDVGLDVKASVVKREDDGLGFAIDGRVDLPTATFGPEVPLASPGLGWTLGLIADYKVGSTLFAANAGTRGVPDVTLQNVAWDDQFVYRLGVGHGFGEKEKVGLSGDLAGSLTYGEPLSNAASHPLEVMAGGWLRASENVVGRLGVGTGLSSGIGSPDFRGVFLLGYEPPVSKDKDNDGIPNKKDACKLEPEDKDNFMDEDGCPDPSTKVRVRVVDGNGNKIKGAEVVMTGPDGEKKGDADFERELHPGVWKITASSKRYDTLTREETVAVSAGQEIVLAMGATFGTVKIIVTDKDGKKLSGVFVVDNATEKKQAGKYDDGAGTKDLDPGTHELIVRANGYKAAKLPVEVKKAGTSQVTVVLEPAKAVMTAEKIDIREKVFFDTGKATVQAASNGLLDDVADILKDHPEVKKIRIEGHTDSVGNAKSNRKLSQDRANAVLAYLQAKGVEASRMEAVGYGPDKPIDPAKNPAAYEKNRRVEFFIVEQVAPPAPPPEEE